MIADELDELHAGVLAFWETMGQDHPPTPEWKRWVMQMLFGAPLLLDGEAPRQPLTHPAHIIIEGGEALSMIVFHLDALRENPTGPIARTLWERVSKLSEDVLAAMEIMDSREEAA